MPLLESSVMMIQRRFVYKDFEINAPVPAAGCCCCCPNPPPEPKTPPPVLFVLLAPKAPKPPPVLEDPNILAVVAALRVEKKLLSLSQSEF
jgi:hypothetical protein